jgi:hypothetical protein
MRKSLVYAATFTLWMRAYFLSVSNNIPRHAAASDTHPRPHRRRIVIDNIYDGSEVSRPRPCDSHYRFDPATATLAAVFILDELPGLVEVIGSFLIVCGVLLASDLL